MNKNTIFETVFLLFLLAGIMLAGNLVGHAPPIIPSLIAMVIIASIATAGFLLNLVPFFNKLPTIVWISFIGVYLSSPYFPWSKDILDYVSNISILAVSTPVLAYAGLAVGKDLELFKQLSWKIIPVAIAVFSGTFIFAAVLAHFTLQLGN